MLHNNVAFKGITYIKGCHPRQELNTEKPMGWRDQMLMQLALEDCKDLIEKNKSSQIDVCLTRSKARLEYTPKNSNGDEPARPVVVKTFTKGLFESMESFYKYALTYAIQNSGKLSQQQRKVKVSDLYGNRPK